MIFRRKKTYLFLGILAFALALIFIVAPYALSYGVQHYLRGHGFPKANVENINVSAGGFYIEKINLDADGFSTAEKIIVQSSWPTLLTNRAINSLTIGSMTLSGEIDTRNNLTIAGWDGKIQNSKAISNDIKNASIENITLDFTTPVGVIRSQGKALFETSNQGQKSLIANFSAQQKQFAADLNMQTIFIEDGNADKWSTKVEITNLSLDIPDLQLARVSGWIDYQSDQSLSAQIVAGAMTYSNIEFSAVNFIASDQDPIAMFQANLAGKTNESFSIEWNKNPRKLKIYTNSTDADLRKFLIQPDKNGLFSRLTASWPTEIDIR